MKQSVRPASDSLESLGIVTSHSYRYVHESTVAPLGPIVTEPVDSGYPGRCETLGPLSPQALAPSLTLRSHPTGATWELQMTVPAGPQGEARIVHLVLGAHPELTLEAAQTLATWHTEQLRQALEVSGQPPSPQPGQPLTIKALAEEFLTDYVGEKRLRAHGRYASTIRVHIIPRIGAVPAETLTRAQVRTLLKEVLMRTPRIDHPLSRARGGTEAARSTMTILRRMMTWAIEEERVERGDNPVSGMDKNLPRKHSRERVLSLEEARLAWVAAETLGYPFGPAYRLMLLTGCRPGEWAKCHRTYVDLAEALLVVPASDYKSQHVHVVPLVKEAVKILSQVFTQDTLDAQGPFIFSGSQGRAPMVGWPKAHRRLLRETCALSGERVKIRWTPHDLRRTVATHIAEILGVGGEQLIRKILGHSDGSVTAIYNRYAYVREMRAALEQWSKRLLSWETQTHGWLAISSCPTPPTDAASIR
jgi:integrase